MGRFGAAHQLAGAPRFGAALRPRPRASWPGGTARALRVRRMTIVVTGGAGFIGSALVRALVADGERVVTLDKLTYAGNLDNLAPVAGSDRHVFVQADI